MRTLLSRILLPLGLRRGDTLASDAAYVVAVYALLAFLSLAVFGSLHVLDSRDTLVGYLELTGAGAVALTLLGLRAWGNVGMARDLFLTTIVVMLMVMLATGGTQGTGIFWFFIFPVAAFFLTDRHRGIAWMIALSATILALWVLRTADAVALYYSDVTIRQLLVCLLVVSVGVLVYQEARERSARHERKIDSTKSEFVTLASHQLRTPISAVKWFSEMLLNGDAGKLTAEQREYIQGMADSNRRLGDIVDTMLLISSLEVDELHSKPEPTDLPKLAHSVLAAERKKQKDRKLDVSENYQANVPKIRVDTRIMKVVLCNLFSNALKYTPDGGWVRVSISTKTQTLTRDSQGSLLIEVADSGYGIPANQQKEVFAKLFRASNIKRKDTDGTGLGLYAVKTVLERVGGRIWFESEENKGTTFSVLLPIEGMRQLSRRRMAEGDV